MTVSYTHLSRLGVSAEDPAKALNELLQIASLPNLAPTGVFTHFSVADSLDPADQAYTCLLYTSRCV